MADSEIKCESCSNFNWENMYCKYLDHFIRNGYAMEHHSKYCNGYEKVISNAPETLQMKNEIA